MTVARQRYAGRMDRGRERAPAHARPYCGLDVRLAWRVAPALRPRLLRDGHGELGALGDAVGPALHDALVARIETHAFFAVGVVVAEQRTLPAAARVPRHGHRNGHVDADRAHLDLPGKCPRNAAVRREARHAIAEFVRVDQFDRRGEVGYAHHAQNRAEDFFAVDVH